MRRSQELPPRCPKPTHELLQLLTRPWTMQITIRRETDAGYQIFESACHEDNKDLEHIKAAFEKGIK